MNARLCVYGVLLTTAHAAAAACDLPKLVVIPAQQEPGDDTAQLLVEMQRYVTGIQEYLACVQAELAAAGGDAAPEALRSMLIRRNNVAADEAELVISSFGERVVPARELYLVEFIAGEGQDCIPTSRLETTVVVDDLAVLFVDRGDRTWLNVLEGTCAELARSGRFEVRRHVVGASDAALGPVQTGRLCSNEFIRPYTFETAEERRRDCALGRFFELTPEQAGKLRPHQ